MFYDLAKFQYFYNRGLIGLGVEIVPCHFLHKQMSTGVSYGEQLIYDLERLSKNFPSVPVKVILVDMPLESDDYMEGGATGSKKGERRDRRVYEDAKKNEAEEEIAPARSYGHTSIGRFTRIDYFICELFWSGHSVLTKGSQGMVTDAESVVRLPLFQK